MIMKVIASCILLRYYNLNVIAKKRNIPIETVYNVRVIHGLIETGSSFYLYFLRQAFSIFMFAWRKGSIIVRKSHTNNRHFIAALLNSNHLMTKSKAEKITDVSETKRKVVSEQNHENKRQKPFAYKDHKEKQNVQAYKNSRSNLEIDEKNVIPNEGSYASQSMQDLFQIIIPDISPNDTKKSKKKLALLLAYIGSNFSGFQINRGQKTLQAEIELSLYKSGLLQKANFGFPHKYGWSVSGRTDKGVHACAQVCSCKLEVGEMTLDEIRESINAHLHPNITILDVKRTNRSFCAKTDRSRVRYQYMIPSYLFFPNAKSLFDDMGINGRTPGTTPMTPEEIQSLRKIIKDYRVSSEQLNTLRTALQKYVGTHAYHNFTKGMNLGDASAKRYILEFSVQDPVVREDGTEWIPTQVIGQAFLLNQIRKMIALVCDIVCERATFETMDKAFDKGTRMILPLAPAQGLFLDMSIYDDYNRRIRNVSNEANPLDWINEPNSPAMKRWKAFKDDVILSKIVEEEQLEGNFIMYLYTQTNIFEWQERYHAEKLGDNC
jgi:tRNA pseudouridine38-40 synthase